jgi:hypothetical protein
MSGFDALIAAWHHDIDPGLWGCTLAMARPIHDKGPGGSLKALAAHYGLPPKGELRTLGKRLEDLTQRERAALEVYNKQDVELCSKLWGKLRPYTSDEELFLIDRTTRMITEPRFVADVPLLQKALAAEKRRKVAALDALADRLEVSPLELQTTLASSAKFVTLLNSLGTEVPTKISPTTGGPTPAVAKTDAAMQDFLEHPDDLVRAAAELRLDVKSTILESRLERMITFADLCDGKMPMPLRYWGAGTGRWSGDFKINVQNFPRVDRKHPKLTNALRLSLCAPKGQQVVVVDLSGIELRVNHFLWKVFSSTELFKVDPEKADLYKAFAAERFLVPPDDVTKEQRQLGKVAQLGLGYGAGAKTFQRVAKTMGGIVLSEEEAQDVVKTWREAYPEITAGWRRCQDALSWMHRGENMPIDPWGLCVTGLGCIHTPKGTLRYPDLRQEYDPKSQRQEWVYGQGRNKARIYGPKLCLAAGTQVLTDKGWVEIENVAQEHLVFDGVEFVNHGPLVFNGVLDCVSIDGVRMTPDHEVLTNDGWQEASQIQRLDGPTLRYVDRDPAFSQRWQDVALGMFVRLWGNDSQTRQLSSDGGPPRRYAKLRLYDEVAHRQKEHAAWYVKASRLLGVAKHGGSLLATIPSGVEKLRRAGDLCVRTMARAIRELLGRHGSYVPVRAHAGQNGQRGELLPGELSLGYQAGPDHEQTHFAARRGHPGTCQSDGRVAVNAVLPCEARPGFVGPRGQAESHPVYDITDAGPRHRFVVLGDTGPYLAHNCENLVQHLSRFVLTDTVIAFAKTPLGRKYPLVHCVHDELVYLVDDADAHTVLAQLKQHMIEEPKWWPALVTWAEGDIAPRYGLAK